MNESTLYKVFLVLAFLFQALIDIGGYLGWYYNRFPPEVFDSVGYGDLIPFEVSFPTYLAWMTIYYLSIVFMFYAPKLAQPLMFLCLGLSFIKSFTSGIWIATPHELFLGWISWASYICSCVMYFYIFKKAKHG
jgi:hypothetical protein